MPPFFPWQRKVGKIHFCDRSLFIHPLLIFATHNLIISLQHIKFCISLLKVCEHSVLPNVKKHPLLTGFPIVGAGDGGPPHPTIFFETLPPSKTMPSMGHTPPTRETPFHGMIPRKSTINSNLKYS